MYQTTAVLLYHSVSDHPGPGQGAWCVSTRQFVDHLRALTDTGATPVALSAYVAHLRDGAPLPANAFVVTFDDGFADQLDAAALLATHGVPSTVYVTSGYVGTRGYLDAKQVRELADTDLVEIGAHSVTHPHLDAVSSTQLRREIDDSRATLQDLIGRPVHDFAYPHGSHAARERAHLAANAWRSGAAVKNALSHRHDLVYSIARVTIRPTMSAAHVAALVDGHGAPVAWRHDRLRTRAARQVRRARRLAGRS